MEFFNFFLEIVALEKKRFNLDESVLISFTSALTSTFSENFDVPYNRCAYLYRYATSYTHFVKNCISKFLNEYPKARDLLALWRFNTDLDLCSLSCGPGIDYLSFLLAVSEFGKTQDIFRKVHILSKHGAWRNTVNFLAKSLRKVHTPPLVPNVTNYQNVTVTQGNIKKSFTADMIDVIQRSEVVLMVKTLNLTAPLAEDEDACLLSNLSALVSFLRPEATVFFIDTRPSVDLMQKALSKCEGLYLLEPAHVTYKHPVTFPELFRENQSIFPVLSARGTFFVWQKSPLHVLPVSPVPPDFVLALQSEKKPADVSKTSTEIPVLELLSDLPLKSSGVVNDAKPINNSLSSNGFVATSPSSSISPSPPQLGSTKKDSLVTQQGSSYCNSTSKLSASTSSSHSDILDSMLAEILNSPPFKRLSPDVKFENETSRNSGAKLSSHGSSGHDVDLCNITSTSPNKANEGQNPECLECTLPTTPPGNIDDAQSSFSSSQKKNSNKLEVIQNLMQKKYKSSHSAHSLESKPTQTDPGIISTDYSGSVQWLTDRVNKLVSDIEQELVHWKDHDCSFSAQAHCCASGSENCDNAVAKSVACLGGRSRRESGNFAQNSDAGSGKLAEEHVFLEGATSSIRCGRCSAESGCCGCPVQVQCCHGQQYTMQSLSPSGPLLMNSSVNVSVPSLVIPLQDINMDVLSRMLADLKK